MNAVLWILQLLLAAAFVAHGLLFLSPPPDIARLMNESLPRWFQLFLGIAEVAAGIGLTLPGLTRIMPWLVTWAAAGVAFVSISATVYHFIRGEISSGFITLLLFGMAAAVVYGRHRMVPIRPRGAATS